MSTTSTEIERSSCRKNSRVAWVVPSIFQSPGGDLNPFGIPKCAVWLRMLSPGRTSCSSRSGRELPQTLIKWIKQQLLHKPTHRVSLLALLETGGMIVPRLSSAEVYLSHLASEAGVDCLCYSDGIPLARTNWPCKVRLSVAEALRNLGDYRHSTSQLPASCGCRCAIPNEI